MLIHQIHGCQQTAENCQIQLSTLAQLTSSHGKKSWDGQKSGRMICRLKPHFPLHHVLRNVGGWVWTPTEPAEITTLWTHRDFWRMFSLWIHQPWDILGKASVLHVGPDRAHVLSLSGHPQRFQTCLGGIYRCRVGILQSTSAKVNNNYVKKMPVAISEEEHFSILAVHSPWIALLSQNLKTSVCRQLACSAFHGNKGIDKTTLLHPPSCQHLDQKIRILLLSSSPCEELEEIIQLFIMCNSQSSIVWLEILLTAWVFQRLSGNERMQLSFNYSWSFLPA